MFNFRNSELEVRPEVPLDYKGAPAIAETVKSIRENRVVLRDSDGNAVRLKYPDGTIEAAAMAASTAPNLPASINALERYLTAAEERVSSAIRTS